MKKFTVIENEKSNLAFISEYDYNTGETKLNVSELNEKGNYNIKDGKPFKDYFNLKGDVTISSNCVTTICDDDEISENIHNLLKVESTIYVELADDNKLRLKIWLS